MSAAGQAITLLIVSAMEALQSAHRLAADAGRTDLVDDMREIARALGPLIRKVPLVGGAAPNPDPEALS